MKRNLVLVAAVLVSLLLAVNSSKRILAFRTTARSVQEAQKQLDDLKRENEQLKKDLELKSSNQFAEEEIRNKLGMAKPGETVVVLPKTDGSQSAVNSQAAAEIPNWQKWWNLFFGF